MTMLWVTRVESVDRLGTFLGISIRLVKPTYYIWKKCSYPVQKSASAWGCTTAAAAWPRPYGGSVAQHLQQKIDVVVEFREGFPQFGDLPARVEDRRMIATAEIAPNLGKR